MRPDEIVDNWSDELLALMACKLAERKKKEADAHKKANKGGGANGGAKRVSLSEFMGMV